MILMNSSTSRKEKKEVPDPRNESKESKSSESGLYHKVMSSSRGNGFEMSTGREEPNKSLFKQHSQSSQLPSSPPFPPTSVSANLYLLSPYPEGLQELENLVISEANSSPLPLPGEPGNWSHYGVYLQDLSDYNATGIQSLNTISLKPTTNSANWISTSNSAFTSSTSSSSSSSTVTKVIAKESSEPRNLKGKLGSEEEEKEKRRIRWKKWYEKNKGRRKVAVLTEEQKERKRAKWREWYEINKDKRKAVGLTEEQKEKKRVLARRRSAEKKLAAEQHLEIDSSHSYSS